jgi:hypothetical protein
VVGLLGLDGDVEEEEHVGREEREERGSASAWPREGSVHTVDPRRKSASSRSKAMTYGEEGRWRGWEERGRDVVGRGVN